MPARPKPVTVVASFLLAATVIALFVGANLLFPSRLLDRIWELTAAAQPFQGGYGVEYFYPTLHDKAACLFFSLAGGHIFGNGKSVQPCWLSISFFGLTQVIS
jgi:hypothetical protein